MSTETQQRGLTAEQLTMLLTPLNTNRVKQHKGNAHLEAWDVRRWLTRIFGFGGWDDEILSVECIHSVTSPIGNDPAPLKHRCTAVYRVTMRLTVKDQWGNVVGHWEDGATGEGVNQVSVGDAHDLAFKAAVSQALKRCAVNLGDQFGLSLYNDGDHRGVVVRTLGHSVLATEVPDPAQDAPVTGGELDEQREAPAEPQHAVAAAVVRKAQAEQPARGIIDEPSQAQHKMLNALIGKNHGRMTDDQRYAWLSEHVGRPIASSKDLTKRDVSQLIDWLQTAKAPVPQDPPGQDFHLPSDIGPEGICSGLVDAMAEAVDADALTALGKRVADLKTKGILHEEHLGRLTAAWNARQQELAVAA